MSNRISVVLAVFAAACLWAGSARAFSPQSQDSTAPSGLPKFDLEEQRKNFRTGSDSKPPPMPKYEFETFLGKGTFEFGLQQGPWYFNAPFGSGFGPSMGPAPRNSREDFNRVITPENLR